MSFNRVIIVGNLTRDPEVRYTPSQMAVVDIGVAVNDKRKDASGQWVEETTFVDVTLWGKTAEVAGEYLKKGGQVLIEGRLKMDSWEDRTSGQKRTKLKVVGERMQMLGKPSGKASGAPREEPMSTSAKAAIEQELADIKAGGPVDYSDIPF